MRGAFALLVLVLACGAAAEEPQGPIAAVVVREVEMPPALGKVGSVGVATGEMRAS